MQDSHQNRINTFTGFMDTDSDHKLIKTDNYRYAIGIRNGFGVVGGDAVNDKGNSLVSYPLNAGENCCIGTYEDKRCNTVIYFIYNSFGKHLILRFTPSHIQLPTGYGSIKKIAEGAVLNFQKKQLIHDVELVNDLLYWVDGYTEKNYIDGNPPRKINIEKSCDENKAMCYHLFVGQPGQGQFADGDVFTITIRDENTSVVQTFTIGPFTGVQDDIPAAFAIIEDQMVNNLNVVVERCDGCKLKIQSLDAEYTIEITSTLTDILLVPENHYTSPLREEHIDWIRWQPKAEPKVKYIQDPTVVYNNVNKYQFQFRTRYYYDDGEKSAWSPISNVAYNHDGAGNIMDFLNAIEVDFTEKRLNDPGSLCIIKKVEIAFRIGNRGLFKTADILDICEIGIGRNTYIFRHDKMYTVVESDDYVANESGQAFKLYDNVPRISGAMEVVADESGNNIAVLGANLENYDCVDCVDIDFDIINDEDIEDCLVTIRGTVYVHDRVTYGTPVNDTTQSPEPSFPDMVLPGFVVYLANTSYYGISDNPLGGGGTGEFEIKNVPRANYIMRVASHKCRYDNSLGPLYNLNNGLVWQKTSAPVINVAGSDITDQGRRFERTILLKNFVGQIFNLNGQPGYGPVLIENLRDEDEGYGHYEIYLVDPGEDVELEVDDVNNEVKFLNPDRIKGGVGVELQRHVHFVSEFDGGWSYVELWGEPLPGFANPNLYSMTTDHNGYCFCTFQYDVNNDIDLQGNFGEFDTSNTGSLSAWFYCNDNAGGIRRIRIFLVNGSLGSLWNGQDTFSIANQSAPPYETPPYDLFAIIYKDGEFRDNNRSRINGQIQDNAGNPLAGTQLFFTRTHRNDITTTSGNYSIMVHLPWSDPARDGDLLVNYISDICNDLNVPDFPLSLGMPTPYDTENPYDNGVLNIGLDVADLIEKAYLKNGGVYRFGIVYSDRAGRMCTVCERDDVLRIPFFTEQGYYGRNQIEFTINHRPPEWAVCYRLVRTKNTIYNRYVVWAVSLVRNVVITSVTDTPVETTFENGDATHILLRVPRVIDLELDNHQVFWFFGDYQQDGGFTPQPYDRIRFIINSDGDLFDTGEIFEYEILGYYVDDADFFIVIKNPDFPEEIGAGTLVEAYSPKNFEDNIFYEIGESHPILDPGTALRSHSAGIQDQIFGVQPAIGILSGGDTYWRLNNYQVAEPGSYIYSVENLSSSDIYDEATQDIGRPNISDPDFGERFYYNKFTNSGFYIPDSNVNHLSDFRTRDFKYVNNDYGIIKKITTAVNVMLVICEFKTQPVYVGKAQMLDLSGATIIGRADRLFTLANETKFDWGTQNPESIVSEDGAVYGYSLQKGLFWRYAVNGQKRITHGKSNDIRDLSDRLRTLTGLKIVGVFERNYGCYTVAFSFLNENKVVEKFTFSFSEGNGGWNSYHHFKPDYFSEIGTNIVSFQDGQLWVHDIDQTVSANNYYGIQYDTQILFVSNPEPDALKYWHNIQIHCRRLWWCPEIYTSPDRWYPQGQMSRLKVVKFDNNEGHWNSDFLRDMLDTHPEFLAIANLVQRETAALLRGRVLKATALFVLLQLERSDIISPLFSCHIEYTYSNDTKY